MKWVVFTKQAWADGRPRSVLDDKKELGGSTEREACSGWVLARSANRNTLPRLIVAHTHPSLPPKCLVAVSRGKISRCGDIIAAIESQHGTSPCVLQTLPNDPAWMRNYLRNGFSETSASPSGNWIGRWDRGVTLQAAIPDALARLCLALSEHNVTFSLTPLPLQSDPSLGVSIQTLPITCSIRSAGLHCNRKNWRAYSALPSAWGQFLQNFIHERGGEFTNWLLYLRIILLYEISK